MALLKVSCGLASGTNLLSVFEADQLESLVITPLAYKAMFKALGDGSVVADVVSQVPESTTININLSTLKSKSKTLYDKFTQNITRGSELSLGSWVIVTELRTYAFSSVLLEKGASIPMQNTTFVPVMLKFNL